LHKASLTLLALFLSHCVSAEVAGMYLFKLSLGNEVVQVAYLGKPMPCHAEPNAPIFVGFALFSAY